MKTGNNVNNTVVHKAEVLPKLPAEAEEKGTLNFWSVAKTAGKAAVNGGIVAGGLSALGLVSFPVAIVVGGVQAALVYRGMGSEQKAEELQEQVNVKDREISRLQNVVPMLQPVQHEVEEKNAQLLAAGKSYTNLTLKMENIKTVLAEVRKDLAAAEKKGEDGTKGYIELGKTNIILSRNLYRINISLNGVKIELNALKTVRNGYEYKLTTLKKEVDDLTTRVNSLSQDKQDDEKILKEAKTNINQLKGDKNELEDKLEILSSHINEIENYFNELQKELVELTNSLKELQAADSINEEGEEGEEGSSNSSGVGMGEPLDDEGYQYDDDYGTLSFLKGDGDNSNINVITSLFDGMDDHSFINEFSEYKFTERLSKANARESDLQEKNYTLKNQINDLNDERKSLLDITTSLKDEKKDLEDKLINSRNELDKSKIENSKQAEKIEGLSLDADNDYDAQVSDSGEKLRKDLAEKDKVISGLEKEIILVKKEFDDINMGKKSKLVEIEKTHQLSMRAKDDAIEKEKVLIEENFYHLLTENESMKNENKRLKRIQDENENYISQNADLVEAIQFMKNKTGDVIAGLKGLVPEEDHPKLIEILNTFVPHDPS